MGKQSRSLSGNNLQIYPDANGLRSKASSQQLLIFRLATLSELPLTQVARKLGVNLAQVYLAQHRVGKLFKAEVQRLRRETE